MMYLVTFCVKDKKRYFRAKWSYSNNESWPVWFSFSLDIRVFVNIQMKDYMYILVKEASATCSHGAITPTLKTVVF